MSFLLYEKATSVTLDIVRLPIARTRSESRQDKYTEGRFA